MTAVDRPDNGQDEGRCGGEAPRIINGPPVFCSLRWGHRGWHEDGATSWSSALASGRAGAGEQQRVSPELSRYLTGLAGYFRDFGRADIAAELLALLGGPQPDEEVSQHRMDADCWCVPVQADNGAWDHQ